MIINSFRIEGNESNTVENTKSVQLLNISKLAFTSLIYESVFDTSFRHVVFINKYKLVNRLIRKGW